MITVYLHVGAEKTGTSAIQAFLNYNRENLIKNEFCLYPNYNAEDIGTGNNCHNHCEYIIKVPESVLFDHLEKAINYCKKKGLTKIIISCEGLFNKPDIGTSLKNKFQSDPEVCFKVIIFLRRQDHFFESGWKQWGSKDTRYPSIKDYIEHQDIQWLKHIRQYGENFGKENIIVQPYENEQLQEGLINRFLEIIDIRYSGFEWVSPPESNLNLNYGFNRDIIEILALNKSFNKNIHDNTLLNFFYKNLSDIYKKKPYEHYDLLSPDDRSIILKKYEPMNQIIAREYLGREDGKLFFETSPDPEEIWRPYEGLTTERIVPIFTEMIYNIDKNFNKQFLDENNRLKQQLTDNNRLLNQRNQQLTDNNRLLNQRNQQLTDNNRLLNQRNQQLTDNNRLLNQRNQQLTDTNRLLNDRNQHLVNELNRSLKNRFFGFVKRIKIKFGSVFLKR